jgi:hypothetical protein
MGISGLSRLAAVACMAVAASSVATASHAVEFKFAEFSQSEPPNTIAPANVFWTQTGATSGNFFTGSSGRAVSTPIQFSFVNNPALSSIDNVQAVLVINAAATGPATTLPSLLVDQPNLQGTFSITYTGLSDLIVGATHYHTGANLLSGIFNLGHIDGVGTFGAAGAGTATGSLVNFTSDILGALTKGLPRDLVLNLTSITPALSAAPGQALKTFKANADGEFSESVPEPATWAMLIVGLGGVGAAMRRRRGLAPA